MKINNNPSSWCRIPKSHSRLQGRSRGIWVLEHLLLKSPKPLHPPGWLDTAMTSSSFPVPKQRCPCLLPGPRDQSDLKWHSVLLVLLPSPFWLICLRTVSPQDTAPHLPVRTTYTISPCCLVMWFYNEWQWDVPRWLPIKICYFKYKMHVFQPLTFTKAGHTVSTCSGCFPFSTLSRDSTIFNSSSSPP